MLNSVLYFNLLTFLFISVNSCNLSSKKEDAVPPNFDTYWDETAEFISGIQPAEKSRYFGLSSKPVFKAHQKSMESYWKNIQKNYLDKFVPWKEKNLKVERPYNMSVYPLSGADFINFYSLYPQSPRYVMISLQDQGFIEDPLKLNDSDLKAGLDSISSLAFEMAYYNYFTSKRLSKEAKASRHIFGLTPTILMFAKRLGFTIVSYDRIHLDENGSVAEGSNASDRIPGIRIRCFQKGDSVLRDILYLKIFLKKDSHLPVTPEGRFFNSLKNINLTLKSAIYVLQTAEYEPFSRLIAERAETVFEDDSGIAVKFFNTPEWERKVFGYYKGRIRVKDTPDVPSQKELIEDFSKKPGELPFPFGYGILQGAGRSNFVFMQKKKNN